MVSTFFCTFAPIIKMFGTMKQRIYKLLLIYVVLVAIFALQHPVFIALLSTGNCKIINLSEENILWGFKI